MSALAIDDTVAMAKARGGYPLVAGHGLFSELYARTKKRHERMRTQEQLAALRALGGPVSVMTSDELHRATACKHSSRT